MGSQIPIKGKCPFCGHGEGHQRNWCIWLPSDGYNYLWEARMFCSEVSALNPGGNYDYGARLNGADGGIWYSYGPTKKGDGYLLLREEDAHRKQRSKAENRQRDYEKWCADNGRSPRRDYVSEFDTAWANGTYSFTNSNVGDNSSEKKPTPRPLPRVTFTTAEVKNEVLPDGALDLVYRCLLSHLKLEDEDRNYLRNEGWTDEMIEKSGIKSFPEDDLLRKKWGRKNVNPTRAELAAIVQRETAMIEGTPGAWEVKPNFWTFAGPSGLIIPTPNLKGEWYRIRIRRNYRDVDGEIRRDFKGQWFRDEKTGQKTYFSHKGFTVLDEDGITHKIKDGGKYRNFASGWKSEKKGVDAGNRCGFYTDPQVDDPYIWFITEGEKKAMYAEMKIHKSHISLPGVNSWSLLLTRDETGKCPAEVLRERGVQVLVSAFDADKHTNGQVMAMEENLVSCEELKKLGFIMGKAFWDGALGKGEDDFLATGGQLSFE